MDQTHRDQVVASQPHAQVDEPLGGDQICSAGVIDVYFGCKEFEKAAGCSLLGNEEAGKLQAG